jgi:hypothetical protein
MSDLYVGKIVDSSGGISQRYLHRITDLVTHTFICGAAGSGKTVMGKILVEEAARLSVPAIVVDLKGDLSSLALAFSEFSARMLAPWIQVEDPSMLGRAALAEANVVRKRLADWGLSEADVRLFSEKVAVEIFTPRSDSGRRVAIPLIPTPPPDIHQLFETDLDSALIMVSSLAEALVRRVIPTGQRDREQEYVTALIDHAWRQKMDLAGEPGLRQLVNLILNPPFDTIGALSVEDHLPDARRQKLAQAVNGQLVGADATWLRGEDLTVDKLVGLNRADKKVQISVINLASIQDFEDQSFVVAQIAFAINSWMRKQGTAPGGNRPRVLFFIDEIGGGGGKTAFYPAYPFTSTAKPALNLLVKQGRAFGVACILATQNPGDIDYKGLSNCSTWIVGKLQTKRDRDKVREGLTDAEFKPADLAQRLARPQTGEFMFMTRDGDIHFVKERWLLTYHCTLSPKQLLRLKLEGTSPYDGDLDTQIQSQPDIPPQTGSAEVAWREVDEHLGAACRYLELILQHDPRSDRAREWLAILGDLDATARRLAAREATAQPIAMDQNSSPGESSLLTLLGKAKTTGAAPALGQNNSPAPANPLTVENSQAVRDDGYVFYKGQQYELYRRYARKPVTFLEENGQLRFIVEGRVLSKTAPLKTAPPK